MGVRDSTTAMYHFVMKERTVRKVYFISAERWDGRLHDNCRLKWPVVGPCLPNQQIQVLFTSLSIYNGTPKKAGPQNDIIGACLDVAAL